MPVSQTNPNPNAEFHPTSMILLHPVHTPFFHCAQIVYSHTLCTHTHETLPPVPQELALGEGLARGSTLQVRGQPKAEGRGHGSLHHVPRVHGVQVSARTTAHDLVTGDAATVVGQAGEHGSNVGRGHMHFHTANDWWGKGEGQAHTMGRSSDMSWG